MTLPTAKIDNVDVALKPYYWLNEDKAQTHYFVSYLNRIYPDAPRQFLRIAAKPGLITLIPHRYYIVSTMDNTPLKGREMYSQQIEEAPTSLLSRGDALGHEERKTRR